MKLIKLQNKFILVSDEEINHKDYVFNIETKDWFFRNVASKLDNPDGIYFKIIAGLPELPKIDFSLLSEEDCKTIGWVDVEKLVEQKYPSNIDDFTDTGVDTKEITRIAFEEGFKIAQSLNDKMFSLEDIREAIAESWNSCLDNEDDETFVQCFNRIIQSLQQTSWKVEVNKLNQIIKII